MPKGKRLKQTSPKTGRSRPKAPRTRVEEPSEQAEVMLVPGPPKKRKLPTVRLQVIRLAAVGFKRAPPGLSEKRR